MSSNPFLDAINFTPPAQSTQSFDRQSYINNMLSNMHGVDMTQLPQNTWQPDDSFINAMSNFSKSGTSGAPSIPGALSNAQTPQGSGGSSGLSFIDRLKNAAGDAWNQTIGKEYSQAKGGLEGLLTGLLSGVNVHTGQAQAPTNVLDPLTGYISPQQEAQKYQATKDAMGKGVVPWALSTAADTVTDPLTYAPVGPALKLASVPAKGLATLAGKGLGAAYDVGKAGLSKAPLGALAQRASTAPASSDIGLTLRNMGKSLFEPLAGTRDYFKQAVANRINNTASGAIKINKQLTDIFKNVPEQTRIDLTHAMEQTPEGQPLKDPVLESLRQKVDPLLQQAKTLAKSKGLLTDEMNPTDKGVARYLPHVLAGKFSKEGAPLTDEEFLKNLFELPVTEGGKAAPGNEAERLLAKVENPLKPSIDANKSRLIEGSIRDINNRVATDPGLQGVLARLGVNPQGKVFEDDMLKVLGSHLHQLNNQVNNRTFLDAVLENAQHIPKELPNDSLSGMLHDETKTPLGQVRPVDKEGAYLLPKAEADYVNKLSQPESAWSKLWRGAVNIPNQLMFAGSPLIHIANNLGTQTLLRDPAILGKMLNVSSPETRSMWKQAFSKIEPGSTMDEALRHGALHGTSHMGASGTTADKVNNLVQSIEHPSSKLSKVLSGYKNLTPNVESVYRTAAYQRGLEKGLNSNEAAHSVRDMYGGHAAGQVSNFDKGMSTVLPFWNWTKTALRTSAENAGNNPAPYVGLFNAMNNANQQVTGHGLAQNPNPLAMAIPEQDVNGRQEYWEPYSPMLEIPKVLKDVTEQGVLHGLANYGFNRSTPLVKYPSQMLTGHQNPFADVTQQYNVKPYPALPGSFNQRGIYFGDKGPQAPYWAAQFAQDLSNPIGDIQGETGRGLLSKLLTNPFISAGGTISAPNPNAKVNEQKYQQSEVSKELKQWAKKNAGK